MMKKENTKYILGIGLLAALVALFVLFDRVPTNAAAPSGLPAAIASSSRSVLVGTTSPTTIFSATTNCASRVISTLSQPILLTISTSSGGALQNIPTATNGIFQGASTTVAYDSGLYGCGEVSVYGYQFSVSVPSTTITILETR